MPRQNRVSPAGAFFADPARGTLMGNRGILHDAEGRLGKSRWKHRHWVACTLEPKGKSPRAIMAPGHYTELFFLDEATALAAGHRPCAECRRAAFRAYRDAFARAKNSAIPPSASAIDAALHADRIEPASRAQKTFRARIGDLPDGAFVLIDGEAHLVLGERCWRWTPGGYENGRKPVGGDAVVLTPKASVGALASGYRVGIHPSAGPASARPSG